jgi:uncharacterized protein
VQTLWGPLRRRRAVPWRRERIDTPDGDFLDLDWLDGAPGAPLLLVLHGLEGSTRSPYVTGLVGQAAARGWRAVGLNFRGCSGEPNRAPRLYHSGETGDLALVVARLVRREPGVRLAAVGVSLGGNVLLKWLGERGVGVPAQVVGAAAISVPFDLAACAAVLDRGLRRLVYAGSFLRTMRRKVVVHARRHPGLVDVAAACRARSFAAYDRIVTAPLHGFLDEQDYWTRSSSRAFLGGIRRPTLLIHALDDPLVPRHTVPDPRLLPPKVRLELTPHGGHVGFAEGRRPWHGPSWAERRAIEFLDGLVRAPGATPDGGPHGRHPAPAPHGLQWSARHE